MVAVYVRLVQSGVWTIDMVPHKWRQQVEEQVN